MSEQAQLFDALLNNYIEAELGRIDKISRALISKLEVISGFSARTAAELDYIASHFEVAADALRMRANTLREKDHPNVAA